MEKTRKILSIVTIVFTALLSLLLIFWLFGLDLLGDNKLKVFLITLLKFNTILFTLYFLCCNMSI